MSIALWRHSFLVKALRAGAGMAEGHLNRPAGCGPARHRGLPPPHLSSRRIRYHAESGMVTTLFDVGADTSFWQPEKTVAATQTLSFRR
ncbi:MAG: hypothetical protein NTY67_07980 [Cyanobacteria bacterium]|nr:hypothetical protein [Cyanobacteriota bacterium]